MAVVFSRARITITTEHYGINLLYATNQKKKREKEGGRKKKRKTNSHGGPPNVSCSQHATPANEGVGKGVGDGDVDDGNAKVRFMR